MVKKTVLDAVLMEMGYSIGMKSCHRVSCVTLCVMVCHVKDVSLCHFSICCGRFMTVCLVCLKDVLCKLHNAFFSPCTTACCQAIS
jgi:hypothetical protein